MQQHYISVRSLIWSSLRFHRWQVLCMVLITLIWAVDDSAVRPFLLKCFIDVMSIPAGAKAWQQLILIGALYVAVRLIVTTLLRVFDWLSLRMVPVFKQRLLEQVAAYTIGHAPSCMQKQFAGALAGSISSAAEGAAQLILPFMGRLLGSAFRVLFATGTLWCALPHIGVMVTLWVLTVLGGGLWWTMSSYRLADVASLRQMHVVGFLVDLVSNLVSVRLYHRAGHEKRLLHTATSSWVEAERVREGALLKLHLLQSFSFLALEACSLGLLIYGFTKGTVTVGDVALTVSINTILIEALWDIPQEAAHVMRALGKVTQGLKLANAPYVLRLPLHPQQLVVQQGRIEYERVTFSYAEAEPLFKELNLTIAPGQQVGIVGYSGSGKSTLVHLLVRLFDVQEGAIRIDGQDIATVSPESLHRAVTLVPQDAFLFHRSIKENILYGKLEASEEEMIEAARKAQVHKAIKELEKGYETIVGERGVHLSAGQRQRILMARAFLHDAPILIMDEATSALDSITEVQLQESIRLLMKGKTSIIVAHRFSTLIAVDRILVLDKGRIVEDGTHQELLEQNGLYRRLWDMQQGGGRAVRA